MVHTVIVNNRSYDLPKKTVAVAEKLDMALKTDSIAGLSIKDKFERLHDFVKEMVGSENAAEMLGSEELNEIDTSELAVIVLKINDAYEKPMNDYQAERMQKKISNIPIEKLTSMTKAAQSVSNTQMIRKC